MPLGRTIWVDADACPRPLKDILCRAAKRTETLLNFVANRMTALPVSPYLKAIQVDAGFDKADDYIVMHVQEGELVITSDIPLAHDVLQKKGHVINYRGEVLSNNDIQQRLRMRDISEQLRSFGQHSSGGAPLDIKQKTAFANALDQWLAKYARS